MKLSLAATLRLTLVPILLTARADDLRGSSFSFGPRAMAAYLRYPLLAARERLGGRR